MTSDDRLAEPLSDEIIGGRFRIRERLDATGRAEVYEAEHVLIHQHVALKVARAGAEIGEKNVARFQRVARVATQLDHPNCVKITDFGTDERGYVYLAMALASGRDLRRILAEDGPLTAEEVVAIGKQAAEGLADAHQRGIVHTELAPHYVMVDLASGTPEVKLLGFGLGQLMKGIERGSGTAALMQGVPADYAAPELLRAGQMVDHRVDQFALAAVLFEVLTGELPWDCPRGEPKERLDKSARRASQVRSDADISMTLDRVLVRALDPDPNRRFADVPDFADSLDRALHGDPRDTSTVASVHRQFGRYRLLRSIARGGMGELHLASSETLPGLTKVCALKRLRPELAAEKSYVERFLTEARLAAQLSHANLATVYDVGKAEDSFYMAMEFVAGKDCRRIIDRAREDNLKIPVVVALLIARDLADALGYAHRVKLPNGDVGLIHRDVSPTNVLVSYEGLVKLIDFGLAKHATAQGKTESGVVIGKVAYMAPEQCLCEPLDHRADIYSVGSVLFELLTGRRLREGEDFEALAAKLRLPPDKLPGELRDDVPAELDDVLARALAPKPDDRYPHAEGLRDDLTQLLASLNPRASRDSVAAFLKELFPAEQQSETELAQGLLTEPAPTRPDSVLAGKAVAGIFDDEVTLIAEREDSTGETMAMPAVTPAEAEKLREQVLAKRPTSRELASTRKDLAPTRRLDKEASDAVKQADRAQASDALSHLDTLDGSEMPSASAPADAPRAAEGAKGTGGPGWVLAIVLLLLGLGGGAAVGVWALPNVLDKGGKAGSDATQADSSMQPQTAPMGMDVPPMTAPRRVAPRPRTAPKGPSVAELTRRVEARNLARLQRLARASLLQLGVAISDLPALPEVAAAYAPVGAAVQKQSFSGALDALFKLRTLLQSRKYSCKKLRRRKFKWARTAVRSIRRAAPRKRDERKKFLALHKWKDLRDQVNIVKKRSQARNLTCAEKSLSYKNLISELKEVLARIAPKDGGG